MFEAPVHTKVGFARSLPKKTIWGLNTLGMLLYGYDRSATNSLPNPINYGEHASNGSGSLFVAAGLSYVTARIANRFNKSPKQVKTIAVAVGSLAMGTANLLSETKLGAGISQLHNTIDPIDLAYGVAGGVVGANLIEVYQPEVGDDAIASLVNQEVELPGVDNIPNIIPEQ